MPRLWGVLHSGVLPLRHVRREPTPAVRRSAARRLRPLHALLLRHVLDGVRVHICDGHALGDPCQIRPSGEALFGLLRALLLPQMRFVPGSQRAENAAHHAMGSVWTVGCAPRPRGCPFYNPFRSHDGYKSCDCFCGACSHRAARVSTAAGCPRGPTSRSCERDRCSHEFPISDGAGSNLAGTLFPTVLHCPVGLSAQALTDVGVPRPRKGRDEKECAGKERVRIRKPVRWE